MIRRILNNVIETTFQQQSEIIFQHPFNTPETIPLGWLMNCAPCFPVKASNISILSDPHQFYDILLKYSLNARERVTFASLYFGNGNLEKNLVENLLRNPNFRTKKLKVNILLDYTRGSRFENNSRTTLLPLVQHDSENCQICLYHTPELRGTLKKIIPHRWNELLGLQHMKLYIFDDTLVISGANLSNDYFTNRQDRYFIIHDGNLCDFYNGLVSKVQTFSLIMDMNNNVSLNKGWNKLPYEGSREEFIQNAGDLVEKYLMDTKNAQNNIRTEGQDTWIFPTIQMGQLGIEQDSKITERLFKEAPKTSKLNIATGYFNLTKNYMDTLIYNSEAQCNVLMAHPKANGFLGAKGLAGDIPYAYTLIANQFKSQFEVLGHKTRIQLFEYLRNGWTYHGKGLWYYSPNSKYPSLTLIGSPNFGERSVKRDLETQLAIVTENMDLRKKLQEEWDHLYKFSLPFENRDCPKWVYGFVYFFRSFF